jgi:hypothetical protein
MARPLRLLSLGAICVLIPGKVIADITVIDGGGVKGLTSLIILQRIFRLIENETRPKEELKPCEYFDLIGGTSTGGFKCALSGITPKRLSQTHCHNARTPKNVHFRLH